MTDEEYYEELKKLYEGMDLFNAVVREGELRTKAVIDVELSTLIDSVKGDKIGKRKLINWMKKYL